MTNANLIEICCILMSSANILSQLKKNTRWTPPSNAVATVHANIRQPYDVPTGTLPIPYATAHLKSFYFGYIYAPHTQGVSMSPVLQTLCKHASECRISTSAVPPYMRIWQM